MLKNNRGLFIQLIALTLLLAMFVLFQMTLPHTQMSVSAAASDSSMTVNQRPSQSPGDDLTIKEQARAAYGKLPLSFEANKGQTASKVNFISRGAGYSLFLQPNEAVFVLSKNGKQAKVKSAEAAKVKTESAALRMKLIGANPAAKSESAGEQTGKVNYFIGSDQSKWRTNILTFGRVSYKAVYNGIDVTYYGNQQQLEYDFIVAPHADYKQIKLNFDGAKKVEIEKASGDLLLYTKLGIMREHQPVVYQTINGERQKVASRYVKRGKEIGFEIGECDASLPLVIDPTLDYSTYLGGSGSDVNNDIAVDSAGGVYLTGNTTSTDFPTKNPAQANSGGSNDSFITKIAADGRSLVYSTYLGGSDFDEGRGIAVDSAGNAYVIGRTRSTDLPTTPNAFQTTYGGDNTDAFVIKLAADGGSLIYSTYLGGLYIDDGYGIAADSAGNAYVTGYTQSTNFPTTPSAFQTTPGGNGDAFITKLAADGRSLVYSTLLGASDSDESRGIAVDSAGNAYIIGRTQSTGFPTTLNAFQTVYGGGFNDSFVTKIAADGHSLIYSTYLGGNSAEYDNGIAVDSAGNAYIAGETYSTNFPTTPNAFQTSKGSGAENVFVTKLATDGRSLVYSTYLGGNGKDAGEGIAVDSAGNAHITGIANSTNFPTTPNALQISYGGNTDAFITKLAADGKSLVYSTYLGGSGFDAGVRLAIDSADSIYVTGNTQSFNFPTTPNAFQTSYNYGTDAFITKINNLAPTSAGATISGRVLTANGRGIINVRVSLTGANGETRVALSNPFGYYRFNEVPSGETYILSAKAKRYQFSQPTQIVSLNEDLSGIDFTALANVLPSPMPEKGLFK